MAKLKLIPIFTLFLNILHPFNAQCEIFEYKHIPNAKYRILSVVDEAVFLNGVLSHRAEILNRIAVEVTGVKDGKGEHKAVFQTSERLFTALSAERRRCRVLHGQENTTRFFCAINWATLRLTQNIICLLCVTYLYSLTGI